MTPQKNYIRTEYLRTGGDPRLMCKGGKRQNLSVGMALASLMKYDRDNVDPLYHLDEQRVEASIANRLDAQARNRQTRAPQDCI